MRGMYMIALLVSIGGLGVLDFRYKLVYFRDKARAIKVITIMVALFVAWDVAGVLLDIFFIGENSLLVGIHIGEIPLEELFFLVLLNYNALIVYTLINLRGKAIS
jgi:lycopene cyclase domain-containing protein